MTWPVELSKPARRNLKTLEPKVALQVLEALDHFAATGQGDIKKLQGSDHLRRRVRE
ncbi:MAG: hypothetical protein IPG45_16275 [Deltaproteobacteria bacterium]|nr:hypothetical protein [Deltaproteobacteria bacterium]